MALIVERKAKQNRFLIFMASSASMTPKQSEILDFFLMVGHILLPVLLVCNSSNLNFIIRWNGERR